MNRGCQFSDATEKQKPSPGTWAGEGAGPGFKGQAVRVARFDAGEEEQETT